MESQIQIDVESLREQCSNTRELYREVCALLFFRYGVTPTTNKLYQLVRKGSMSVPTEVLSHFWKDLREKSKTRIEQPDLPEDLGNLAGELIAKIWDKAQLAAHESLSAFRNEAEVQMQELQTERDTLAKLQDELVSQLRGTEKILAQRDNELNNLKQLLAESEANRGSLEQNLQKSATQLQMLQQTMETEVERLRVSLEGIEQRRQNEVSQAERQIAREKARADDFEQELGLARIAYREAQDQYTNESNTLKTQLADLRERLGELNGKLELTQAHNQQLSAEMSTKDEKLKEMLAQFTKTEVQAKNWSERIQQKRIKRYASSKR